MEAAPETLFATLEPAHASAPSLHGGLEVSRPSRKARLRVLEPRRRLRLHGRVAPRDITYRVSDCFSLDRVERLTIRGGGGDRDKVVLVGRSQDEAQGFTLSCLTIVNEVRSDEALTVCCFSGRDILFDNCVVLKRDEGLALHFSAGTVARVANCDVAGMLACEEDDPRDRSHVLVERSTLSGASVLDQSSLTLCACQVGDGFEHGHDFPTCSSRARRLQDLQHRVRRRWIDPRLTLPRRRERHLVHGARHRSNRRLPRLPPARRHQPRRRRHRLHYLVPSDTRRPACHSPRIRRIRPRR